MLFWKLLIAAHAAVVAAVGGSQSDPYTNWTEFHYLPTPMNGPPCTISNNKYGWNTLRNVDGSLYTTSKRPIVLTLQRWESFILNTYVAQYLLEIMGYRVQIMQTGGGYTIGPDFYGNAIDLFLEAWPEDQANYGQMTQVDRVAVDLGAIGYSGIIGLYVPTALVNQHPDMGFDFWRFLLHPEARALLPQSGSTPPFLVDGQPQCDGRPKHCVNGTYTPPSMQGSWCQMRRSFGRTIQDILLETSEID
ncbi:hypothetical protein BDR26DRAFT_78939 [Obelidium mucronatum]|nr:hypothetical protein BDR26DRAFT_78939 [Obelidium mucronatum]